VDAGGRGWTQHSVEIGPLLVPFELEVAIGTRVRDHASAINQCHAEPFLATSLSGSVGVRA
jgi:hypothetical protein